MIPLEAAHAEGIRLWWQLLREAGKRHVLSLAGLAVLGTLLDAGGLGLAVTIGWRDRPAQAPAGRTSLPNSHTPAPK